MAVDDQTYQCEIREAYAAWAKINGFWVADDLEKIFKAGAEWRDSCAAETAETAEHDTMQLAEMVLSDCGISTVISDRLQRRVAERIQRHVDGLLAAQPAGEILNDNQRLADLNLTIARAQSAEHEPLDAIREAMELREWKAALRGLCVGREPLTAAECAENVRHRLRTAVAAQPAGDGCGACGDACASRGSCRLDDESPQISGEAVAVEFFAYDPECGFATFKTEVEAKNYAQDSIDSYREEAAEGWPEEVENVRWGVVFGRSKEVPLADNDGNTADLAGDRYVDYVLTERTAPPAMTDQQLIAQLLGALTKIRDAHRFNVAGITPNEIHAIAYEAIASAEAAQPVGRHAGKFFAYDDETGFDLFDTAEEAKKAAPGNDPSISVIQFVLQQGAFDGFEFLQCWNEGDFETCRREWPEAPPECYIGADPLLATAQQPKGDE